MIKAEDRTKMLPPWACIKPAPWGFAGGFTIIAVPWASDEKSAMQGAWDIVDDERKKGRQEALKEAASFIWNQRDKNDWDISDAIEWLRSKVKELEKNER